MSVYSDVKTLIGEPSGATYYTNAHICHAINEAELNVYMQLRNKHTSASLTFGVGVSTVVIPSTIMIPKWIEYGGHQWFPTTYARLEQYNQYWRTEGTTRPSWFVLTDWNHLRCWPDPDATYNFTLHGVPYPDEVDGSTTLETVDSPFVKSAIAYRAVANLVEHDFPQLAAYYFNEAQEYLMKAKINFRDQQSHNLKRLQPGTVFTNAQSGSILLGSRMKH
jgi:hypothetical protein